VVGCKYELAWRYVLSLCAASLVLYLIKNYPFQKQYSRYFKVGNGSGAVWTLGPKRQNRDIPNVMDRMRCLAATGWMANNRLRCRAASMCITSVIAWRWGLRTIL